MPTVPLKNPHSAAVNVTRLKSLSEGRKHTVVHLYSLLGICHRCQWRAGLRCADLRRTAPLTHSNYCLTGSGVSTKCGLLLISVIFRQQHYSELRKTVVDSISVFYALYVHIHKMYTVVQLFLLEPHIKVFVLSWMLFLSV